MKKAGEAIAENDSYIANKYLDWINREKPIECIADEQTLELPSIEIEIKENIAA